MGSELGSSIGYWALCDRKGEARMRRPTRTQGLTEKGLLIVRCPPSEPERNFGDLAQKPIDERQKMWPVNRKTLAAHWRAISLRAGQLEPGVSEPYNLWFRAGAILAGISTRDGPLRTGERCSISGRATG
jgi:hypothetical protein